MPGEGVEPSRGNPRRFLRARSERFSVPGRANLGRRVFGGHVSNDSVCYGRVRADGHVGVRVGVLRATDLLTAPTLHQVAEPPAMAKTFVRRAFRITPPRSARPEGCYWVLPWVSVNSVSRGTVPGVSTSRQMLARTSV